MFSNMSSTPMSEIYNPTPPRALCGPCVPRPRTQPTPERAFVHRQSATFGPGLGWENSPYVSVPLSNVSAVADAAAHILPYPPSSSRSPAPPHGPRLRPIALPPQITCVTAVTLNPMLRVGAKFSGGAHIDVDFGFSASDAGTKTEAGTLMELAAFPGLPSLTLLPTHLPWAITVHATGSSVVVGDVLQAIKRGLGIHITEEEFMEHGGAECIQGASRRGFKRRRLYRSGMTRLGLLAGRTRFAGLSE
ncbi:hypothetical protein DFH06DRAFT_1302769, partial [Mycena polygramma]